MQKNKRYKNYCIMCISCRFVRIKLCTNGIGRNNFTGQRNLH